MTVREVFEVRKKYLTGNNWKAQVKIRTYLHLVKLLFLNRLKTQLGGNIFRIYFKIKTEKS